MTGSLNGGEGYERDKTRLGRAKGRVLRTQPQDTRCGRRVLRQHSDDYQRGHERS